MSRGRYRKRKKFVPDGEPAPDTSETAQCERRSCGRAPLWAEFVFLAPNAGTQKRIGFLCTVHKLEADMDGSRRERLLNAHKELLQQMNNGRVPHPSRVFLTIKSLG